MSVQKKIRKNIKRIPKFEDDTSFKHFNTHPQCFSCNSEETCVETR